MKRTMYSVLMFVVIPVVLGLLTLVTMRLTGFSLKQAGDIAVNVVWFSVVAVFLIRVIA